MPLVAATVPLEEFSGLAGKFHTFLRGNMKVCPKSWCAGEPLHPFPAKAFCWPAEPRSGFDFSPHEPQANAGKVKRVKLNHEEHGLSVKNAGWRRGRTETEREAGVPPGLDLR
jgi:hypothetical protein